MFGIKLQTWDENIPGRCYYVNGISKPNSLHPLGDQLYLAVTCLYFFTSMGACGIVALNMNPQLQRYLALRYLISELGSSQKDSSPMKIFEFVSESISNVINKLNAEKLGLKEFGKFMAEWYPRYFALSSLERTKLAVLTRAMLQYPLHIYMIFALRAANEYRLNGDSENYWGFGQIVALVLLASSVLQGFRALLGRFAWPLWDFTNMDLIDYRRTLKKKWLSTLPTRRASI